MNVSQDYDPIRESDTVHILILEVQKLHICPLYTIIPPQSVREERIDRLSLKKLNN